MIVDASGNVIVGEIQPLKDLGDYFAEDYDDVAHTLEAELSKGDEDEDMANLLNY